MALAVLVATALSGAGHLFAEGKAADKSAKTEKAAGKKAAKKKGPEWKIPWLEGTSLTSETVVLKRFGRLQRNERWDNLQLLYEGVFSLPEKYPALTKDPKGQGQLRNMLAYAHFYRARHRGREIIYNPPSEAERQARVDEVLADLQKGVELGYRNPDEIETAKELYPLWENKTYQELVVQLRQEAVEAMQNSYKQSVDESFARLAELPAASWRPELESVDDAAFWADGEPMVVIVSRTFHDGLDKFAARIRKSREDSDSKVRLGLAFYQLEPLEKGNEKVMERVREYTESLELGVPTTFIDRDQYKSLRKLLRDRHLASLEHVEDQKQRKALETYDIFQPVLVFFDGEGTPIFQTNGVLLDWQIDYVFEKFQSASDS